MRQSRGTRMRISRQARNVTLLTAVGILAASPGMSHCNNTNALGVARVVEIDTTGGPLFGSEQYKGEDFLRPMEVVLTFDDGPSPTNTHAVLVALAHHCTKATFFPVGQHSIWHPNTLRDVAAAGHTIGGHSWSHPYLSKLPSEVAIEEIEKGFSAIKLASGGHEIAPFFRFPYLEDAADSIAHLAGRNIATFSHDVDSLDYAIQAPEAVVTSVMRRLQAKGRGIVLLHDAQQATAHAAPMLLDALAAARFKIVHITPKVALTTLPVWDKAAEKECVSALTRPAPN
jgi:peptidoglycan/xylan/chitin deacetylase (PgdA/CDA1 family)